MDEATITALLQLGGEYWPLFSNTAFVGVTLAVWRKVSNWVDRAQDCLETLERTGIPVHIIDKAETDGA